SHYCLIRPCWPTNILEGGSHSVYQFHRERLLPRSRRCEAGIASVLPRCTSFSSTNLKASYSIYRKVIESQGRSNAHDRIERTRDPRGRLLLGYAGFAAPLSGRDFDARRLYGRRRT